SAASISTWLGISSVLQLYSNHGFPCLGNSDRASKSWNFATSAPALLASTISLRARSISPLWFWPISAMISTDVLFQPLVEHDQAKNRMSIQAILVIEHRPGHGCS